MLACQPFAFTWWETLALLDPKVETALIPSGMSVAHRWSAQLGWSIEMASHTDGPCRNVRGLPEKRAQNSANLSWKSGAYAYVLISSSYAHRRPSKGALEALVKCFIRE